MCLQCMLMYNRILYLNHLLLSDFLVEDRSRIKIQWFVSALFTILCQVACAFCPSSCTYFKISLSFSYGHTSDHWLSFCLLYTSRCVKETGQIQIMFISVINYTVVIFNIVVLFTYKTEFWVSIFSFAALIGVHARH